MPGKGRATGYSDFYKRNSMPSEDRESETNDYSSVSAKKAVTPDITDMSPADRKKVAIKRRLQKMREGK